MILKHFDSEGIMALIAPRPFLALTGDRDAGSPPEGMKKREEILGRVYKLYGKPESFRTIIYPETGHVYARVCRISATNSASEKTLGPRFIRSPQPAQHAFPLD